MEIKPLYIELNELYVVIEKNIDSINVVGLYRNKNNADRVANENSNRFVKGPVEICDTDNFQETRGPLKPYKKKKVIGPNMRPVIGPLYTKQEKGHSVEVIVEKSSIHDITNKMNKLNI